MRKLIKKILNENEWEWINDVKSHQDIAQEIADETKIKNGLFLSSPYLPYVPFALLPPSSFSSPFSFTKYGKEVYGLDNEDDINDVWERYKKLIKYRINNLNESDDMQWIKDIVVAVNPDIAEPYVSFEDAVEGETYRVGIKNWDRFEEMLEMCSEYDTHVENIIYVNVYSKSELSCDEVYCEECDYWEGEELCLDVIFLDSNKESILSLWMSRDLIQLYLI
jgi:hypothetical protein